MPGIRATLVLFCLLAAAVAAGCGDGGSATIPPRAADNLLTRLGAVESAVESGECEEAEAQAEGLVSDVETLADELEADVHEALAAAAARLSELTAEQCEGTTGPSGAEALDLEAPEQTEAPPEEAPEDDQGDGEGPGGGSDEGSGSRNHGGSGRGGGGGEGRGGGQGRGGGSGGPGGGGPAEQPSPAQPSPGETPAPPGDGGPGTPQPPDTGGVVPETERP